MEIKIIDFKNNECWELKCAVRRLIDYLTETESDWFLKLHLTLSPPIPLKLYTMLYWSNPPFLIFDIQALWRSGLSATAPECQKLKMVC